MAEPGGICISHAVLTQTRGKLDFPVEDIGVQTLKNIAQPVHVWRVGARASRRPAQAVSPMAEPAALPLPDKPSIAVLPFQNMSGDPEQEYFADGMVEEIITALSRIRWLFVIARNSSFTYKGHAIDVKQVGRELGVRYVLEGSVRKAGIRVRITAKLIEAESGTHLWFWLRTTLKGKAVHVGPQELPALSEVSWQSTRPSYVMSSSSCRALWAANSLARMAIGFGPSARGRWPTRFELLASHYADYSFLLVLGTTHRTTASAQQLCSQACT
jgi:TolB-like protein